jgi:thioester reductase-like protein
MLRFAQSGVAKRVHHISSTFIFGWTARGVLLESDSNEPMADLDFGYAQTKWVAEQLVLAARSQGVDARIYRPAFVSASIGGMGHRADVAVRMLAFMINHGIAAFAPSVAKPDGDRLGRQQHKGDDARRRALVHPVGWCPAAPTRRPVSG